MITSAAKAVCRGRGSGRLYGYAEHFFSNDYGGGDRCWRCRELPEHLKPHKTEGWVEASPVMPEVVEGSLQPPPLTQQRTMTLRTERKPIMQSIKVIPTRTGKTLEVRGHYVGGAVVEVDLDLTNTQVTELVGVLTNGGQGEIRCDG